MYLNHRHKLELELLIVSSTCIMDLLHFSKPGYDTIRKLWNTVIRYFQGTIRELRLQTKSIRYYLNCAFTPGL